MSKFDVINDAKGKEYLVFDSSELYDDSQMGNKSDDFEILKKLGSGAFGKVFKVKSKINNKVYAMKIINIEELKKQNEKAYQLTLNETEFLKVLSHPHVIKYYKCFIEGKNLYIIIEFAENGDIECFIEAHKKFKKQIQEEELWNIFLQCMGALAYVHSMGVIHRDIKPANLLMDNNMTIKLGDFGVSAVKIKDEGNQYLNGKYNPFKNKKNMQYGKTFVGTKDYMAKEIIEENEYDQKVDVYSMGVSFYEMCYFHIPKRVFRGQDFNGNPIFNFVKVEKEEDKDVHYSQALLNIINLMLEEDKERRKTSEEIFNLIKNEYSKRYVKNTSIDSIIRCLYSFTPLTTNFLNNINQTKIQNKLITKAYIQCLQSVSNPSLDAWINSINYIRQALGSENPKLEGSKEVEPRYVFAFLIKELHKELNNPPYLRNKSNKHLIISGEEESRTSEVEVMCKFVNDIYDKFNSLLSNAFLGLMKLTNVCNQCNIKTYSFSSFFFVTFNLENIFKNNYNNSALNLEEQFIKQNKISTPNLLYCSKCLNKTYHKCYKEFYSFSNLLVISIQRGITYNYKNPIKFSLVLNLTNSVQFQYSKKIFNLVGLLGRLVNNGNESYFSVVRIGQSWFLCEGINIKEINSPFNYNPQGDILMLFYM